MVIFVGLLLPPNRGYSTLSSICIDLNVWKFYDAAKRIFQRCTRWSKLDNQMNIQFILDLQL